MHTSPTTPPRRASRRRRLLGAAAAGVMALGAFGLGSSPAGAEPVDFTSPVTGSLTLAPPEGEEGDPFDLPPGVTLTGTYDDETGELDADLFWPETVTQLENDLVGELDATIQVLQVEPVAGTIDPDTGEADLAASLELHLIDLSTTTDPPASLGGGDDCRFPMELVLTGSADEEILNVEVADLDFAIEEPTTEPEPCGPLSALIVPELAAEGNAVELRFELASFAAQVEAIYQAVLGRSADASGLEFWSARLQAGVTPTQVAIAIAREPEGWRNAVADSYLIALGRDADPDGLRYWTEAMRRSQEQPYLVGWLLASPEADGLARDAFPEAETGTEAYVEYLYATLLSRASDEAGRDFWVQRISSAPNENLSRLSAGSFFYRSPEIVERMVAAFSTEVCGAPAEGDHQATLANAFTSSNYNTRVLLAVTAATPCPELPT